MGVQGLGRRIFRRLFSWRRTFSQFGEDSIVEHLFPSRMNGRYLDIGCYHPYKYSNTANLYSRGWSGVNVDANPYVIDTFNKSRSRDTNLNFIIGTKKDNDFWILNKRSAENTSSLALAEVTARAHGIELPQPIKVNVASLAEIMDEHFQTKPPEYLNIDAEASDLEVLKSGDWTLSRPSLVSVEDGAFLFDEPLNSDIYRFMRSVNYCMYSRCHATSFFVDDKCWPVVQHGGSLEGP